MSLHKVQYSIAGTTFDVQIHGMPEPVLEKLQGKYEPFQTHRFSPTFDVRIQYTAVKPDPNARPGARIHQTQDDVEMEHAGMFRARFNLISGEVNAVVMQPYPHPVENLFRLLLADRLPRIGGALFHAASIDWQGEGLMFAGQSEAGKTTLAAKARRDDVLTDEVSALTRRAGGDTRALKRSAPREWNLHATPFWGDLGAGELGSARRADALPLRALALLSGKGSSRAQLATPAEALQALIATVFCYGDDAGASARVQEVCAKLIASVPIVSLSTTADESIESIVTRVLDCAASWKPRQTR